MTTVQEEQTATSDAPQDPAAIDATAPFSDAPLASERGLQILKVLNDLFDQSESDDA